MGALLVIVGLPILFAVVAIVVVVKVASWLALLWLLSLMFASLLAPLLRPRSLPL